MKKAFLTSGLILAMIFLVGCSNIVQPPSTSSKGTVIPQEAIGDDIKINSKGVKYLVDPDKIRGGGPPKGGIGFDRGIPALALNNIKFVTVQEADEWIEDNELVLALVYKGVERVYPLQILVFHEIANDIVAGDPLLITYCPLCGCI